MKKTFVSFLVLCAGSLFAGEYSQDFTAADGTTDLGDGTAIWSNDGLNSVQNNALRLTEAGTNSSNAAFKIPAVEGTSAGWYASYKLTLAHTGPNTPADGLSFSYGVLPGDTGGLAAEEGWNDDAEPHIAFQVDTWKWDDAAQDAGFTIRAPHVSEADGDSNKGFAHVQLNNEEAIVQPEDTQTGHVMMSYNAATNTVGFKTTGFRVNADFSGVEVPAGFSPDETYQFGIRARTGGHNETAIVDNLYIQSVPEPNAMALFGMGILGLLRLRRRVK